MSSAALLGARDTICSPRSGLTSWPVCGTSSMWVLVRLGFPPAGVVTIYERGTAVSLSSTSTGFHFSVIVTLLSWSKFWEWPSRPVMVVSLKLMPLL